MTEAKFSGTAATRRGVHDRLTALDSGPPPTYDPRKTLALRVEFARQLKRRRTQIVALLVVVLPIIIAVALILTPVPAHTVQSGWSPTFWLVLAPACALLGLGLRPRTR